jgi:1-acyl-sn-glycerol-3-phosphate acyltransferase
MLSDMVLKRLPNINPKERLFQILVIRGKFYLGRLLSVILRVVYQPHRWILFPILFAVTTFVMGSSIIIVARFFGPKKAMATCAFAWARLLCFFTPLTVKIAGKVPINASQSFVIVSNHLSHFDIPLLIGWLGMDFRWVMKNELRIIPVFGIACEKMEYIYIDRSNTESALKSINNAKKKIVDGTSVMFFPEGTRSRNGELGKFKKGAFKMAMDLGIPILPVTISGTGKILPANTWNLFPGRTNIIVHAPIATVQYSDDTIRQLIDKVRTVIDSELKKERAA